MSFSTRIELSCDRDGCKHAPLVEEGPAAKRFDLFTKAKAAGWQWVSAEKVFCPDHRTAPARNGEGKGKGKGKAAKATPKGAKGKATKTKVVKGSKAPAIVGSSTGKLAKSAKSTAA